jgi:hypothetical protein
VNKTFESSTVGVDSQKTQSYSICKWHFDGMAYKHSYIHIY